MATQKLGQPIICGSPVSCSRGSTCPDTFSDFTTAPTEPTQGASATLRLRIPHRRRIGANVDTDSALVPDWIADRASAKRLSINTISSAATTRFCLACIHWHFIGGGHNKASRWNASTEHNERAAAIEKLAIHLKEIYGETDNRGFYERSRLISPR